MMLHSSFMLEKVMESWFFHQDSIQRQMCARPTGSKVKMSITCCIPDSVNRLVQPPAPTMCRKENVYQVHPLHKEDWH